MWKMKEAESIWKYPQAFILGFDFIGFIWNSVFLSGIFVVALTSEAAIVQSAPVYES